jgi:hypothetical protein
MADIRRPGGLVRRPKSRSRCPVLVIDDDAERREIVVELLTTGGYPVSVAETSERVVKYLAGRIPTVILVHGGTEESWLSSAPVSQLVNGTSVLRYSSLVEQTSEVDLVSVKGLARLLREFHRACGET